MTPPNDRMNRENGRHKPPCAGVRLAALQETAKTRVMIASGRVGPNEPKAIPMAYRRNSTNAATAEGRQECSVRAPAAKSE